MPPVAAGGQGGLLDVVTDNGFARTRRIYFCFAEPAAGGAAGNSTAVARATLSADASSLQDVRVIFSQRPKVESALHFGCRIAQASDGNLFVALGERYHRKDDAQKLDNHHGKVIRITPDGAAPPDNPYVKQPGALPEIWSYGHRNPQGATHGPDGKLWMHEHGPQGGDEINLPQPGRNYGWPVITYGENYGGGKMGEGTARAGMEQPLHQWTPSIAPSGMAFLTSMRYGTAWQGSLFVGSLKLPADGPGRAHPGRATGTGWLPVCADGQPERTADAADAALSPLGATRVPGTPIRADFRHQKASFPAPDGHKRLCIQDRSGAHRSRTDGAICASAWLK
jgi:glucose/arabinose dehydrogenase